MKLPALLAAVVAAALPAPAAFAQDSGGSAQAACSAAITYEVRNRYPEALSVQTADVRHHPQSKAETLFSGRGQFDDGGGWTPFSFDCTYNTRTKQAGGVRVDAIGYGGGGGYYYVPPGGGGAYYPPPGGGGAGDLPPAVAAPVIGSVTPLRFAKGASNNTVRGTVRADRTTSYSVESRRGQVLNVGLRSNDRVAYFNVVDPSGQTVFDGSGGGDIYRGHMDERGRYRIDVYLPPHDEDHRGRAAYSLNVKLTHGDQVR
jgi:hypothetical protein